MQFEYFTLPLALDDVIRKKKLKKCTPQESVMQHLHLLLTTGFGEFPGDENFGCGIWDHEFDNVSSAHKIKEIIRQSLLQAIQKKVKLLGNVRVEVNIIQEEVTEMGRARSIKKRIDIMVTGVLQFTNERLQFRDSFFIGPLSY